MTELTSTKTIKTKLQEIKIVTCHATATAKAETLAEDARWQPLEVEYWQRLHDSAADETYRCGYSTRLLKSKCMLDAIKKLEIANAA
jgi:hypothetical protein